MKKQEKEIILLFQERLCCAGLSNIRLDYNVENDEGIIDLSKNNLPNDTLTINGDYRKFSDDENTGELRVNTFWHNPDIQQTDKLIIEGNHEGTTTVKAYYQGNESIFGDVTRSDVEKNGGLLTPVVEIKGEERGKCGRKSDYTIFMPVFHKPHI